ncbi:nucleotidyltransferase family protein [Paenibacillus kandeliae]|uniref:nucleotidyltransferase family protein n=1 Tax=Paenibacillus kandeliae TaxID=3231269 RepID=UPI0034596A8D
MSIAALVLAAGKSSRMGRDKLSLPLVLQNDSSSTVPQTAAHVDPVRPITIGGTVLSAIMAKESIDFVVIVLAPYSSADWIAECQQWQQQSGGRLQIVVCEQAEQGMSYSIRTGMQHISSIGASHVLIMLADQPLIAAEHLHQLTQYAIKQPQLDYVAASDGKTAMPPIVFSPSAWQQLEQLQGDQGARKLLSSEHLHGAVIQLPAYAFWDADTPEALAQIRLHLETQSTADKRRSDEAN